MSEEESTASSSSIVEDTPSENGSEPTAAEAEEVIPEVTTWLDNLHLGSDMAPQPPSVVTAPAGDVSGIKINPPQEFRGAPGTMERFRMQCLLAIEMSGSKLSSDRKQVLYVVSFLRGPAYEWIHPHFKDFLQHSATKQKEFTKKMFKDYESLFDEMEEVFDNGDEALEADRDIRALRQRTSVAQYRAEFQILAAKLDWNDDALASEFYRGLKDKVREEITLRNDRPSNLKDLSELAIKIDNRIFELQLEKRGSYAHNNGANKKAKRNVPDWNDNYYGLQKMQIDATKGKPGSNNKGPSKGHQNKRPQPKTKGTADKSNVECYGCGKKGHYKNECNARKQRHELQGSGQSKNGFRTTKGRTDAQSDENAKVSDETRVESMRATQQGREVYDTTGTITPEQDSHAALTWTACYDDGCAIHYSDKYGSGYWPQRKTRSVCRTIGQPSQAARFVGGHPSPEDSSTEEESAEEESEPEQEPGQVVRYPAGYPPQQEESSEEEGEVSETESINEPVGVTEFTRTFYSDDPTLRLLEAVADSRPLLLPWDSEGRSLMVDESELWELFTKMRKVLWEVPHAKNSIDYQRIVQEFPPLGSRFTPQGEYVTPDKICITRTMRLRVMELKKEYVTERQEQDERTSQTDKAKVYMIEQSVPIIPENYGDEPVYVRKRPMTLQERPPTPHTQAGTSAVLQRDSRMTFGYTVRPVMNSQNLGPRERLGLYQTDPRRQVILEQTPLLGKEESGN
jgi:hypothetical protein